MDISMHYLAKVITNLRSCSDMKPGPIPINQQLQTHFQELPCMLEENWWQTRSSIMSCLCRLKQVTDYKYGRQLITVIYLQCTHHYFANHTPLYTLFPMCITGTSLILFLHSGKLNYFFICVLVSFCAMTYTKN